MEFAKRKATRLSAYDYSSNGAYFVTICTQNRKCILSNVVGEGLAPPEIRLSKIGKIAEEEIIALEKRYSSVKIKNHIIMPNHIHLLVELEDTGGASPSPTLIDVVRTFKSITTRRCGIGKLFQRSYHDHVIRNEKDYTEIWEYIDSNAAKWAEDRYHC